MTEPEIKAALQKYGYCNVPVECRVSDSFVLRAQGVIKRGLMYDTILTNEYKQSMNQRALKSFAKNRGKNKNELRNER